MLIPFFGPFVSWAPPVVVAVLTDSPAIVPILIVMVVGWFILMNIVQPRLMEGAVGIHPIAVLGSVLIGSKIAGIGGAIFAIPFAAVISAIFFHYLRINNERRSVAERAADRASERAGRPVRVPREPTPRRDNRRRGCARGEPGRWLIGEMGHVGGRRRTADRATATNPT